MDETEEEAEKRQVEGRVTEAKVSLKFITNVLYRHMMKNMRFLNQNLSLYAQIAILWFTEEKRQWM